MGGHACLAFARRVPQAIVCVQRSGSDLRRSYTPQMEEELCWTSRGPFDRRIYCSSSRPKNSSERIYYYEIDVEYGWYNDRDNDGIVCER